jgi:hypothetical protein
MNPARRFSCLTVGLALLFIAAHRPVRAQDSPLVEKTETAGEGKTEERIYALLEDASAKAQTLRLPENRVRFQTTAACLLWPRNESRARAIINDSMSVLAALIAGADRSDPQFAGQAQTYTILRLEIVRMVAARDAKLAFNFLRETRQARPANPYAPAARAPDQELALELTLAAEIAATDAGEATRIAEESLKERAAAELLNVLGKLGAADREAATRLASDTIRRLQTEDLSTDGEAVVVAVGLLNMTHTAGESLAANSDRPASDTPPDARRPITIDEQTRRDLINSIAAGAAATPASRMNNAHLLYNSLPAIMPEIEKYAPGQLAAIRAKSEAFRRSLDPSTRAWQKYEGLRQQGTADALLEAAAKAPPEVGDELYAEAAFKVLDGDDPERARQIISSISDPQRRALKSRMLEQQLLERALLRGKLEDAGQRLPPNATVEERVSNLLYLSTLATQRKETALTRRFLSEALGLVGGHVQNGFQFSAQLRIVRAFSAVEPKQSFALLDDLANQLNDLLAAAATVDGFGPDCFRDGELKSFVGNMWGELVKQFGEELAALAPEDFERAQSIAQKFQKDEVRIFMSLRIAERVLPAIEAKRRERVAVSAK